MRKLLFTLVAFAALNLAKADPPFPGVPYELIGTLDGPNGTVHMKKGYAYHWETVLEEDDYGYVRACRRLYITYKGRRVTD